MSQGSDDLLREFLVKSDAEILSTTFLLMDSMFSLKSKRFKRYHEASTFTQVTADKRCEIVNELVLHLKYFGSHGISYLLRRTIGREAGVTYMTMLRDVARAWNVLLRPPLKAGPLSKPLLAIGIGGKKVYDIPRIATVQVYEKLIVDMVVSKHLSTKSQAELQEALKEAGLDEDAAEKAAKEIGRKGVAGGVVVLLVKLLGKKAVKEIVISVLKMAIQKQLGKEGAELLMKQLAKKIPQKAFARLASGVGIMLVAYDAVMIPSSPATRVTIPTITYLATMRYCSVDDE